MAFPDYDYDLYEDFEDALSGWTEVDPGSVLDPNSINAEYRGSQGMEILWGTGGPDAYIQREFTNTSPVSWGFWYYAPPITEGNFVQGRFDINGGGAICVSLYLSYITDHIGLRLRAGGGTYSGTDIAISSATWYWITVQAVNGGTCTLRVYNTSHNQVGSDATVTGEAQNIGKVRIAEDTYDVSNAPAYFDEVVVDYTDGTFPLLGWESGSGSIVPFLGRKEQRRHI